MNICLVRVPLHLQGIRGLKEKRGVVRKVVERTRAKFHISIAEVDHHDLLQRATVGFALVGTDQRVLESTADHVLNFIADLYVAEIGRPEREHQVFGEAWTMT